MNVNWSQAALNIRNSGKSLQSASLELNMGKGVLGQISRGETLQPNFINGLAILNYHVDLLGAEKTAGLYV